MVGQKLKNPKLLDSAILDLSFGICDPLYIGFYKKWWISAHERWWLSPSNIVYFLENSLETYLSQNREKLIIMCLEKKLYIFIFFITSVYKKSLDLQLLLNPAHAFIFYI